MLLLKKTEDVLLDLGTKVKALRLSCNWTREELSGRAGIPLATLRKLEQTGEASMRNYIKVMRTLNALDGLEDLLKPPPVSPYELAKLKGNVRMRGSSHTRKTAPGD